MTTTGRTAARLLSVAMAALLVSACDAPSADRWPAGSAAYDFDRPAAVFRLSKALDEISGLAVLENGTLAAVQDEDGILYILHPETGAVLAERDFGGGGDYEAVALVRGRLYVLESNGTVRRLRAWNTGSLSGDELKLDLPGRCDAEGLRYDPAGERLLVSCKDEPGPHLELEKAIFAFDLDGNRRGDGPVITLDPHAFSASVEDHPVNEAVRSVLSRRIDLSGFKPSELAVHPITGEIFVLSSVREALLSVAADGTVSGVWKLDGKLLGQPEAMDFLPDGDLFVASETSGGSGGVLARYTYQPEEIPPRE